MTTMPRGVYATPASPAPYILTDAMRADIAARGTNDAPTIRALAAQYAVPFYWMREQVLTHGRGVDHQRLLDESMRVADELVAAVKRAEKNNNSISHTRTPDAPPEPALIVTVEPEPEPKPEPEPDPALQRVCANGSCGKTFTVKHRSETKRYCTYECFTEMRRRPAQKERLCANEDCGKRFIVPPNNMAKRYCSHVCANHATQALRAQRRRERFDEALHPPAAQSVEAVQASQAPIKLTLHVEVEVQ